jgi:hypothetical protein
MERKYGALRVIATGMKVLGFIVGILTVLAICGFIGAGVTIGAGLEKLNRDLGQNQGGLVAITSIAGGLLASLLPIIIGGSLALILFAGGEAIYVQIDIEENTRKMAWYLPQRASLPVPISPVLPDSQQSFINPEPILNQANPIMIYCPQCGAKLNTSEDKNCPQCGYDLS